MASTSSKSLAWTCALITGGGGGIGRALAEAFIKAGKDVILVGRTESNLKSTAQEIGAKGYYVVDLAQHEHLDSFVDRVISERPEVDCLINNAGVQKWFKFNDSNVKEVDWMAEVNINAIALVKLSQAFIPHFQSKPNAAIINIIAGIGYVPLTGAPIYCATKAFVKSFTLSLRYQLRATPITVIEISPPLVDTDLHRDAPDPKGYAVETNPTCISQEAFIKEVMQDLNAGHVEMGAGIVKNIVNTWRSAFGALFDKMNPPA